ncbi:MAG: murein L,D-transpeptidase catalytic domain family protein, partial [Cyclobacteriaceae bacterium]
IIDFSKPSSEKRLYVVDFASNEVLLETYVAHGKNSGNLMVKSVSNKVNSNQSSQGFFKISEKYYGKHGESYRLDGLEQGINHNARKRAVVIHGAWYANEEIVEQQGRLGRSFGCPALPLDDYKKFVNLVDPNTLMFIYFPNENYISNSAVLSSFSTL